MKTSKSGLEIACETVWINYAGVNSAIHDRWLFEPELYGLNRATWRETTKIDKIHLGCLLDGRESYPPMMIIHNDVSKLGLTVAGYDAKLRDTLAKNGLMKPGVFVPKLKEAGLIVARSINGIGVTIPTRNVNTHAPPTLERHVDCIKATYYIRIKPVSDEYACPCGKQCHTVQAYIKHRSACGTIPRHKSLRLGMRPKDSDIDPIHLFDIFNRHGMIEWKPIKYLPVLSDAAKQFLELAKDPVMKASSAYGANTAERLKNLIENAAVDNKQDVEKK